jgi:hypothetical protein
VIQRKAHADVVLHESHLVAAAASDDLVAPAVCSIDRPWPIPDA